MRQPQLLSEAPARAPTAVTSWRSSGHNHIKRGAGGVVCGRGDGGWGGATCCSILERGAGAKLAAQLANVYNGIESCPA